MKKTDSLLYSILTVWTASDGEKHCKSTAQHPTAPAECLTSRPACRRYDPSVDQLYMAL